MKAYCFATGLIEFGNKVPSGAITIAGGRPKALRAFIEARARHGYSTRLVKGRPTKIPGSDTLLVPGVPEVDDEGDKLRALRNWCAWLAKQPPVGVRMIFRDDVGDVIEKLETVQAAE